MGYGGAGDRRDGRVGIELEAHRRPYRRPMSHIRAMSLHELLHAWPHGNRRSRALSLADRPHVAPAEHAPLRAGHAPPAGGMPRDGGARRRDRDQRRRLRRARPGAAPAFLGAGTVCAALVAYLLAASARAVGDPRLRWMAAGSAIACAGLFVSILGNATIFPTSGPVSQTADAAAARYVIWHAGLAAAAVLAVTGARPTRAASRRPDRPVGAAAGLERRRRRAARQPRDARERVHGACSSCWSR